KSPTDSYKLMREKATYYLANGCQMVWLVYPEKAMVEIYHPEADIEILFADDVIRGGSVLPDFELSVRTILV
ncbi:MAG: Uma2 family endonuclease, partial [Phototrophicaceae bacterium]